MLNPLDTSHDESGVCTLTLRRPERLNALDRSTLTALRTALTSSAERGDRAIILRGSGSTFSTGADLNEIHGDERDLAYDQMVADVRAAITAYPAPIIAAVHGRCYGAALDLTAATDLVVASHDCLFALPALRLGLLYDVEALSQLSRRLRPGFLARLLFADDEQSAGEAATGGLVDVLTSEPVAEAGRIASAIAAAPRAVVRATVGVLRDAGRGELDAESWQDTRRSLANSPERHAAVLSAKQRLGLSESGT